MGTGLPENGRSVTRVRVFSGKMGTATADVTVRSLIIIMKVVPDGKGVGDV